MHQHPGAVLAIIEAWQRLVLDGLIVNWPSKDPRYDTQGHGEIFQLTRWGRQVRARGADGRELVAARRRLGESFTHDLPIVYATRYPWEHSSRQHSSSSAPSKLASGVLPAIHAVNAAIALRVPP